MKDFTIIEMLVCGVIVAIVILLLFPIVTGNTDNYTVGINGVVEMRCINGYQFTVDNTGNARQVIDSFGKGLECK